MARRKITCPTCGYTGRPKAKYKGNTKTEVLLWLCFGVPGLCYSIWRLRNKYYECPQCNEVIER